MKTYQLLIILLFFMPDTFLHGQSGYEYPIKPGTEEWKKLKNIKEKVEVCLIPDSIHHILSTEELFIKLRLFGLP